MKFRLRLKAPFIDSFSDSNSDIENTTTNKIHKVLNKQNKQKKTSLQK